MTTEKNIGTPPASVCIDQAGLARLFAVLQNKGYTLVGPTLEAGAIGYDVLESIQDLPAGWTDRQDAGSYRLERREDDALFGYTVGPHSWKKYLFPPKQQLWKGQQQADGSFEIQAETDTPPAYAFIGVRACELHAIQIQDKVFLGGEYQDSVYAARRKDNFLVAVNCAQAASTCFCTSMGTGPKVDGGSDLVLTEIVEPDQHYFVVEAYSDRGRDIMQEVPGRPSQEEDRRAAQARTDHAIATMGRTLDTTDIQDLLYRNYDNPRWQELESRCLTCGNCTMACPTCFCSKVEDVTDLTGEHAERWRSWDSCFTLDFSYLHGGGSVRASGGSRYRHWLTHKLGTWLDQFGSSGCVGCGRCITWCPVGIDLTEEVRAIRESESQH
jgi:ferredoxin